MSEELEPDIVTSWKLERGNEHPTAARFVLRCTVTSVFLEPTRDEIRTALAQIFDEALGPDETAAEEIAGWTEEKYTEIAFLADATELEHLRRWKAEALPLLGILERCHEALPGHARAPLGASKAQAVYDWIYDRPIIDEDD